ncbi:GNAT family protein, partial [uncultured Sphingopyxis sp.]
IGFEALELAIDYCWRQLNLRRLTLEVFAHNEAAIRLYARSGFEREGMLKSAQYVEGAWIDIVLMALQRPGG